MIIKFLINKKYNVSLPIKYYSKIFMTILNIIIINNIVDIYIPVKYAIF